MGRRHAHHENLELENFPSVYRITITYNTHRRVDTHSDSHARTNAQYEKTSNGKK